MNFDKTNGIPTSIHTLLVNIAHWEESTGSFSDNLSDFAASCNKNDVSISYERHCPQLTATVPYLELSYGHQRTSDLKVIFQIEFSVRE